MENEKTIEMPVFDTQSISGMTPEQLDEYGRQYTEAVEAYTREQMTGQIEGIIGDLEEREREQEWRSAKSELTANADYYDFADKLDQVEKVIEAWPSTEDASARTRMTMAYLMIKGAEAIGERKNPTEQDPAQLAEQVWNNDAVMKLLAERRAREAAQELPVFARAASGAANTPAPPKTLSDASANARKYFEI